MQARRSWRCFAARLPGRITACWRFKAVLAFVLSTGFTVAYLLIGHHPLCPVHTLPLTWLDRAAGFHPMGWVWVYQSVYLPMNLIPWLAERADDLRRYVRGFVLLSLASFAVFVFFPTRAPKPIVTEPQGMYWLLQVYDAPNNALPSLHVGLLVYTLAFGRRILKDEMPQGLGAVCVAWALLVAYSTLATKEHYAVDLPAGAALGIAAHWWAWRRLRSVTPEQAMVLSLQARPAVEPLPGRC